MPPAPAAQIPGAAARAGDAKAATISPAARRRKADIGFPASSPEQRPPDRRVQRSRLPFRLERILSWIAGKANGVTAPEVPRGRFSGGTVRSEERRVGKGGVSRGRN